MRALRVGHLWRDKWTALKWTTFVAVRHVQACGNSTGAVARVDSENGRILQEGGDGEKKCSVM